MAVAKKSSSSVLDKVGGILNGILGGGIGSIIGGIASGGGSSSGGGENKGYVISDQNGKVHVNTDYGPIAWGKEQAKSSKPAYIDPAVLKALANKKNGYDIDYYLKNEITGEVTFVKGQYNNGTGYNKETGQNILDGMIDKNWILEIGRDQIKGTANILYRPPGTKEPVPPGYVPVIPEPDEDGNISEPVYYVPAEPSPPELESFTVPAPTFNSQLEKRSKFIYFFGVDKIEVKNIKHENTAIRVFGETALNGAEWISIHPSHYASDKAAIEYSILEGETETPILPHDDELVLNERLFPSLPTRFPIEEVIEIKKDGEVVSISIDDAKTKRDGIYSVTYKTKEGKLFYPKTEKIEVKAILRSYTEDADLPYIENVKIRLYGGDGVLWQENS